MCVEGMVWGVKGRVQGAGGVILPGHGRLHLVEANSRDRNASGNHRWTEGRLQEAAGSFSLKSDRPCLIGMIGSD